MFICLVLTKGYRIANKKESKTKHTDAHDHSSELKRISRIKGQMEGVERMIVEKRYCPDIVMQIKAIRSALRSLEANVIEGHMHHCVKTALESRNPKTVQEKLEEILLLLKSQS